MERSRTSRRLKQAGFFTVVLIIGNILLSGCGQHSTVNGVLGVGGVLGQQTFDEPVADSQIEQRPYLALTPADEVAAIRDSVQENAANKELASQVVSANVTRVGAGAEVQIRTTTSNSPLIFKGDLKAQDLTYIGNFPESSGQRPDLTLYVSCSDQGCLHADLFLADNQGRKTAIVVSTEDRVLHTTVPEGETEDQVKGLFNVPQNTRVHYNLTEIMPGVSTYTVSTIEKDPRVLFHGPLQNTEDGLVAAQSDLLDKTETASLAGVDTDNLVLQVASTPDPKKPEASKTVIVSVQAKAGTTVRPKPITPKGPTATATAPENCKVHLTGEVNPMVKDILKECNQKAVADGVSWWKYSASLKYHNFMRYYDESKSANPPAKGLDFKKMVDLLHLQKFPTIWSWVTNRESAFNYRARGLAGELGVWQIAPKTRAGLKMDDDGAREIDIATKGAMTLYQSLINKYPHNIPMILAGYNRGEGGAHNMQVLIDSGVSDNFWQLCTMSTRGLSAEDKKKVPPRGTCEYVGEIIAGMITSLDPADYGMTNIGAMEAK